MSASVAGKIETAFGSVIGINELNVDVSSDASYVDDKLEIALVVDVTGSMSRRSAGGSSKIEELREAVETDFLGNLFPDLDGPADNDRIRISLVPYSSAVDVSETPPLSYRDLASKCMAESGIRALDDNEGSEVILLGNGMDCPRNASVIPMTNNPKLIIDRLNGIVPDGVTAGHLGLLWGWNTISENWAAQWPADSRPSLDSDEDVRKIVVFMTDGQFNTYYQKIGTITEDERTRADLQRVSRFRLGGNTIRTNAAVGESEDRARYACDAMSAKGYTVYTIGFAMNSGQSSESVLRDCATNPSKHFFDAAGGQLGRAFEEIASDVKRIWLSS